MERTRTNRDKDLGRIVRFFVNRLSGLALVSLRRWLGDHSLRISDRMRKPEAGPLSGNAIPVLLMCYLSSSEPFQAQWPWLRHLVMLGRYGHRRVENWLIKSYQQPPFLQPSWFQNQPLITTP